MSEIPKLVTDRLRRSVVTTHPDADVLAAFAEKSLSDRERAPVLAHLAICADCREVVAVATLAELEPVSANVVQGEETAPGRSWFRWPVLRWGAAAALARGSEGADVTIRLLRSYKEALHTARRV